MSQRTLVSLLSGVVCLGLGTHAFAQDAPTTTERHGIMAGMGLGNGWVSQDLCLPHSCDAGMGVAGQVGWVWRKDLAVVWGFATVDAGGTSVGGGLDLGPSVNFGVLGASIKYWPRAGRGWLSAGAGFGKFVGGGTLRDDAEVSSRGGGAMIGAGWEMWRKERRMTLDLDVHGLVAPNRENWVRAAILTVAFNWYQVKAAP